MSAEVKARSPKVRGPSQLNEEVDPKFERVKAEIKAELLPKGCAQRAGEGGSTVVLVH